MSVCIPDTSALMAIAQKETCHNSVLQEISNASSRILLSLVYEEFRAVLAQKFVIIQQACGKAMKKQLSEDELTELIKQNFGYLDPKQMRKLLELTKRFAHRSRCSATAHSKVMSELLGLILLEPINNFEELRKKLKFQDRDDDWSESLHSLSSTFGSEFNALSETDKKIISQAFSVKRAWSVKACIQLVTMDKKWKFIQSGIIKSFTVNIFERKKGVDVCVRNA
jgi:uncharacterized protein with PIN domain